MHKLIMYTTLKHILTVWLFLIGLPLCVVAAVQSGQADEAQALLTKGNAAYAKGQFQEAANAYQQLISQGHQSAGVYYNLGNAHYRLEQIPEAILNYEKAHKLAPGDEDIQVNLRFANQKITDKIEAVPEFFLFKWWKGLVMAFSLQTWAVMAAVLCFLGFVLLVIYLFSRTPVLKKGAFYAGSLLLLVALFSLLIANRQYIYLNNNQQAIVFNGTVNVKSAPGGQQKTLFVIHEGTKVQIGQRENDWIKIVLPNGNIGWIESAAVKEI
jgi:tetratricopeptide (TPR) repeat protein